MDSGQTNREGILGGFDEVFSHLRGEEARLGTRLPCFRSSRSINEEHSLVQEYTCCNDGESVQIQLVSLIYLWAFPSNHEQFVHLLLCLVGLG